jgi:hypothetical protein
VSSNAYVETPAVKLGQNFTVVAVVKPRYSESPPGSVWLWHKYGTPWFGEISAVYRAADNPTNIITFFRVADASSGLSELLVTTLDAGLPCLPT